MESQRLSTAPTILPTSFEKTNIFFLCKQKPNILVEMLCEGLAVHCSVFTNDAKGIYTQEPDVRELCV